MTKRANGEGSTFRRKDGSWSGELSYRDLDGAAKRRTVYGKTQTEARTKLKEVRQRIEAGAPVKDAKMTLARGSRSGSTRRSRPATASEVVPGLVELEVAVPRLTPTVR
jgi:hypothetical protein